MPSCSAYNLCQRGLFVISYIFEKAGNISNPIVPACSNNEETVTEDDLEIANSLKERTVLIQTRRRNCWSLLGQRESKLLKYQITKIS
jgi:hypothetical protein